MLWGHDAARLPIGRAFDLRDRGWRAESLDRVHSRPTRPKAARSPKSVYRLARAGFIAATSVGFRPLKWDYTTDQEARRRRLVPGIDFEEQELVELSVVTVPANPEALIEAPGPGEGTAIAADTPPVTGEEVTAFNQEQITARARRRRAFQLALATAG